MAPPLAVAATPSPLPPMIAEPGLAAVTEIGPVVEATRMPSPPSPLIVLAPSTVTKTWPVPVVVAETAVPAVASTSTTCRSMSPDPVSVAMMPPDTPEVLEVVLTVTEPPAAEATMATPEVVLTGPAALIVTLSVESVPVEVARMPPVEPMTAPWVSTVTAPPGPEPPGVLLAAMAQPPDFDWMVEAPP